VAIFNAAIGAGAMLGAWLLSRGGFPAVMAAAGLGGVVSIFLVHNSCRSLPLGAQPAR